MRGAVAGALGIRRLAGAGRGFEADFDSLSGERAVAVFNHAGAVAGQYFANGDNTLAFGDLISFTRASDGSYVDSSGIIQIASSGVHRLDHDKDGNRLGLLREEARTSIVLQSNGFDESPTWVEAGTSVVSANTTVAPDGTTTAETLTDNDSGSFETVSQLIDVADDSATYATSIFVKKDSDTSRFPEFQVRMNGGTSTQTNVQLNTSTGATTIRTGPGSASVEDCGDYWRLTIIHANNGLGNVVLAFFIFPAVTTVWGDTANTATGSIIVWGAQVELGSTPSSDITTTTVAVTRLVDDAPAAVSGWDFSATVGSLYGVVTPNHLPASELILFSLNDGTANEVIEVYIDSSANVRFRVTDGGVDQCDIDSLVNAVAGTELKIAVSWAASDFAISVNGATIAVDTGGTLPTVTTLDPCENGHTASLAYYKATLSDADLVARTA